MTDNKVLAVLSATKTMNTSFWSLDPLLQKPTVAVLDVQQHSSISAIWLIPLARQVDQNIDKMLVPLSLVVAQI